MKMRRSSAPSTLPERQSLPSCAAISLKCRVEKPSACSAIWGPQQGLSGNDIGLTVDCLVVAESQKAIVPVIGAHAGIADPAERKRFNLGMAHAIVDRHGAGSRLVQDMPLLIRRVPEIIKSERPR